MSDSDGSVQQQQGEQPANQSVIQKPIIRYAGKYETPEALEKGGCEALKMLDMPVPEDGILVGQGRMFKDHATLEESYKKWSGRLKPQPQSKPATQPEKPNEVQIKAETPAQPPALGDDADWGQFVESKGLQLSDLEAQWLDKGELTPEQYKALGVPKATVNQVIGAMQVASAKVANEAKAEAVNVAGGESELQAMIEWAANGGMDKAWIAKTNAQLRGDPSLYPAAVALIKSAYEGKAGTGGSKPLVGNGVRGPAGGQQINKGEMSDVLDGVRSGDQAAIARLNATPFDQILKTGGW